MLRFLHGSYGDGGSMRYIINAVHFDEDGSYTIQYLDKSDALRRRGALLRASSLTVAPDAGELYKEAKQILDRLYGVLGDATEAFMDEAPFVPEDEPDEEDDDDRGMGW